MESPLESRPQELTRLRDTLNELRDIMASPALWAGAAPPSVAQMSMDALCGIASELEERVAERARALVAANEELRRSERNSRLVVDSIPGLVALLTAAGEVEFVNRQILDYTGQTLDELKHWGTNDTVHRDDLSRVIEIFTQSIASGSPYEIVQRLRRYDGVYRWFQNSGFPLRDPGGRIVRWCVLLTDVDERRRAEDGLRERERESRLIVDSIPGLVAQLTPMGQLAFVNRQILEYTGRSVEELREWGTSDTVHPDDLAHVAQVFADSIQSARPYQVVHRLRRSDGTYRWFQTSNVPLHDANGHITGWCALLTDIEDQRRAEDAVRERERELRLIVDTIPGLIAVFSANGALESANPQLCAYFGMSLEELAKWQELGNTLHPDDRERAVAAFLRATELGEPFDLEVRSPRADGVYCWLHSRGVPLRDSSGHIVRWYNLLTDIDERKRVEEALRLSERNLQLIIDTIPALAWSARPDGGAEFFNRHYQDFAGMSEKAASDWGWTAAVHPDDVKGLAATWQRIMASGAPGEAEARLRRHDGEYRWFLFRTNPLRDDSGKIVRWYGVNTDIEDRKRTEEARRSSEAFLLDVQRLTRVGGWRYDPVSDVVTNSAEIHRAYSVQPGDDVSHGSYWFDRLHPDDRARVQAEFGRCVREKADYRAAYRIVWPDGSIRYHRAIGHPVTNEAGELVEFIGAAMDMTDEWRATTELERASEAVRELQATMSRAAQVATVGELAASIAHEVNQPLSGIITNANTCLRMLAADPPNLDGAQETVRRALRDGNRASDVISRLRALFRKKEFAVESLDLNEVTREVLSLSLSDLQKNHVSLHSELVDELPAIAGDRIQLQQVILNLLRNASDAMVDVGDRPRKLLVRTERDGDNHVRLSVRDTGVGIDPQNMNKLFDAFFTTKTDGMGIGLSLSRSIIDRHHGRLWAEPNDGPGATFSLSIPSDAKGMTSREEASGPLDTKV